jgi:DNA repair protein RadC
MSSERIKTWPTKERPRERLLEEGPERMTDAELLAIILRVGSGTFKEGVPGKNAYDSALSILSNFRGLRGLDRARVHDLLRFPALALRKLRRSRLHLSSENACAPGSLRPRLSHPHRLSAIRIDSAIFQDKNIP